MINRKELTGEQAFFAIDNGEFSDDVKTSTNKVVIILTQDWCPQWKNMQNWIYDTGVSESVDAYELVYNKKDYYQQFMAFKENKLGNHNIPYLRFYKDGKLFKESNYISQTELMSILESK